MVTKQIVYGGDWERSINIMVLWCYYSIHLLPLRIIHFCCWWRPQIRRSWSFNSDIDLWRTTLTVTKGNRFSEVVCEDSRHPCLLSSSVQRKCHLFLHFRSKEIGIQQPNLLHARLTTAPSPRLLHKNKRNVKIYRILHVTHCYIFLVPIVLFN